MIGTVKDIHARKCAYTGEHRNVRRNMKLPPFNGRMDVLACSSCEWDCPDIVPPEKCPHCNSRSFYRRPRPGALLEKA